MQVGDIAFDATNRQWIVASEVNADGVALKGYPINNPEAVYSLVNAILTLAEVVKFVGLGVGKIATLFRRPDAPPVLVEWEDHPRRLWSYYNPATAAPTRKKSEADAVVYLNDEGKEVFARPNRIRNWKSLPNKLAKRATKLF